jgi:hypothetical protein
VDNSWDKVDFPQKISLIIFFKKRVKIIIKKKITRNQIPNIPKSPFHSKSFFQKKKYKRAMKASGCSLSLSHYLTQVTWLKHSKKPSMVRNLVAGGYSLSLTLVQ